MIEIAPQLVFPILVIFTFLFWLILAIFVDKILDILERKRNNKCN